MSMMADYFKEFYNDEVIENESGFAVYRFLGKDQVYIVHIYVVPYLRKSKAASALADAIVAEAKQRGCTELLGTVVPSAPACGTSLRVLLGYGMEMKSIDGNMIVFSKGI